MNAEADLSIEVAKNSDARNIWTAMLFWPLSFFGLCEPGFGLFSRGRILSPLRGVPFDEPRDEPLEEDLCDEADLGVDWPELLRADTFPW